MIEFKKVHITLNNKLILKDISLKLCGGKHYCLLGKSGSGKTTFLNTLNFIYYPDQGEIYSQDYGRLDNKESIKSHRKQTATIFQNINLIPGLNVLENVLLGKIHNYGVFSSIYTCSDTERTKALESLNDVGLIRKSLENINNLSGGEKQRVAIARAIYRNPKLLIADEPVSNLDPKNTSIIMKLIKKLCKKKIISSIISFHNPEIALKFSRNVVAMKNGKIFFTGSKNLSPNEIREIYN